ncbi:hypothetical protein [Amycolatopsis taiwanensis]|uniref:hypothetical protein n=1 Tax=Amycolatopsis taiwanensis TaxID=342230 RepID=UPI0004B2F5B6|nr:hypothetical protein [Amycolatopsis taiwanensis]
MKLVRALGMVIGLGVLLAGCDEVGSAMDKASACSQALGLADLNPNIDPSQLPEVAGQKADELRQLAEKVADQDLKQNLLSVADAYVSLQKRSVDRLSDVNDWIQRNAANLDNLRAVCL